jgi:hypothetical protein
MNKILISLLIRSIIVFVLLFIAFYIAAFFTGYGLSNKLIDKEFQLFKYFALAHICIVSLYFFYRKKLPVKFLWIELSITFSIWLITALLIGYNI